MVASGIRYEERRLLEAFEQRGEHAVHVDTRKLAHELGNGRPPWRAAVNRELSYTRACCLAEVLAAVGVPTVNGPETTRVCGDKLLSSLRLVAAGLPMPRTVVAFGEPAALGALDELGYPAVLKPIVGSWGRLCAKVDTPDAADALVEHKHALPGPAHHVFYGQEYVETGRRDLRAVVVGGRVVAAMERRAETWRANLARAGTAVPVALCDGQRELALAAAAAVGAEVAGVDLLVARDGTAYVNETNHNVEFRGVEAATGEDVAGAIADYVLESLG